MYLLLAVCLCAAVSGAFRAVFAVCYPTHEAVSLFAAVVLLVWARTAIENLYIVRHRRHCLHCFVLVFPLLMLILPHRSVSVSSVSTPAQSHCRRADTARQCGGGQPDPAAQPQRRLHRATAESSETRGKVPETEEQPAATPQPDIADSAADVRKH